MSDHAVAGRLVTHATPFDPGKWAFGPSDAGAPERPE